MKKMEGDLIFLKKKENQLSKTFSIKRKKLFCNFSDYDRYDRSFFSMPSIPDENLFKQNGFEQTGKEKVALH